MLRAENSDKMKKFGTMIEAAEYIHSLDVTIAMKTWLIRDCVQNAMHEDTHSYNVSELEWVDVFVWKMPHDLFNQVGINSVVESFKDTSGMGFTVMYDPEVDEVIFFMKNPISPVVFIQFGVEIGKFKK